MARYLRHKNRKGRTNRVVRIGTSLPALLDRMDTTGGLALVALWRSWNELMGEMAPLARPLGHRGRKLILAAEDPMIMQEAQFLAPLILEKINGYFGQEVFDKVVFELLNGRVPLDREIVETVPEPKRIFRKPKQIGSLDKKLDPESALGKCYRAYRKLFEDA